MSLRRSEGELLAWFPEVGLAGWKPILRTAQLPLALTAAPDSSSHCGRGASPGKAAKCFVLIWLLAEVLG